MRRYSGIVTTEIMQEFPSRTGADSFPDWVANHAGLEQVVGIAGFFDTELFLVGECIFRDSRIAARFSSHPVESPFGNDRKTVERYYNILNLSEFFLLGAGPADHVPQLVSAFGEILLHFWKRALNERLPEREFEFELTSDPFDEEGLCITFSQTESFTSDSGSNEQ